MDVCVMDLNLHAYGHMWACVWSKGVFLIALPFMEAGSLIGTQDHCLFSPVLGLQAAATPAQHGAKGSNSGLHMCTAGAFPLPPLPQDALKT